MRKYAAIALGLVLFSPSGVRAQELRTNDDGSTFVIHLDPRAEPRMTADEAIQVATDAELAKLPSRTVRPPVIRVDLVLAEQLDQVLPGAPFQEEQRGRWVWVVRIKGRFEAGRPGVPVSVGSEGYYIIDDETGLGVGWGFKADPAPLPSTAPSDSSSVTGLCQRHYAAMEHTVRSEHLNNADVLGARSVWRVREVDRAVGQLAEHAEQSIWVETGFSANNWVEVGVTEETLLNSPHGAADWYYSGRMQNGFYGEGHFFVNGIPAQRSASDVGANLEFKAVSCKRMEPGCTSADPNTFAACINPIQGQRRCTQWTQTTPGTNHWQVGLESTCEGARVDATYVSDSQYRFGGTSVNPFSAPQPIRIRPVDLDVDILLCSPTNYKRYRYWMNPQNSKNVCGQ